MSAIPNTLRYSEENIFTMLCRIGQHAGAPVSGDRYRQVLIGESIWPNLCFDLRLDEVLIDHEIAQIKHRIAHHLSPPVCMFTPGILSDATFQRFEKAASGYGSWTAMSLKVDPEKSYLIENKWIRTSLVSSETQLKSWCRISNESLKGNSFIHHGLFTRLLADPDFGFFLAFLENEPVAAAMSFSSGASAGLYLVSTVEKYRGNGFGAEITASAIEHLKSRGISEIHLQATSPGQPVYTKLGFSQEGKIHVFNLK